MTPPDAAPLVLTAVLAEPVQGRLDALRRAHFPPERNHLAAHATLFHHLPGAAEEEVAASVAAAVRGRPAPGVALAGLRPLGRGVAVRLESPDLLDLRDEIAAVWRADLTAQDRGKRELHVTLQNKVTAEQARATYAELEAGFAPERTVAVALALWRYLGGPWQPVRRFPFPADDASRGT